MTQTFSFLDGEAVTLTGLDLSMKPAVVRFWADQGSIRPFTDSKITAELKTIAKIVYEHEKLAPVYQSNVCDGKNTLAYFICAVQHQKPPRTGEQGSPKELSPSVALDLAHWDSLFYALVAEIRNLYADLEFRFGPKWQYGYSVLHFHGKHLTGNASFSAIEFAGLLEEVWDVLVDPRLIARLDQVVREKNEASQQANAYNTLSPYATDPSEEVQYGVAFDTGVGLVNVLQMHPQAIAELLWSKYAPELCRVRDAAEAVVRQDMPPPSLHSSLPKDDRVDAQRKPSLDCSCQENCICRSLCNVGKGCFCQGKATLAELRAGEVQRRRQVREEAIHAEQLAAERQQYFQSNPFEASQQLQQAVATGDRDPPIPSRYRSRTNVGPLLNIPRKRVPSNPHRGELQLNLYGDRSPGRYNTKAWYPEPASNSYAPPVDSYSQPRAPTVPTAPTVPMSNTSMPNEPILPKVFRNIRPRQLFRSKTATGTAEGGLPVFDEESSDWDVEQSYLSSSPPSIPPSISPPRSSRGSIVQGDFSTFPPLDRASTGTQWPYFDPTQSYQPSEPLSGSFTNSIDAEPLPGQLARTFVQAGGNMPLHERMVVPSPFVGQAPDTGMWVAKEQVQGPVSREVSLTSTPASSSPPRTTPEKSKDRNPLQRLFSSGRRPSED